MRMVSDVTRRLGAVLGAALLLVSQPAAADTYCGGNSPVARVLTYHDGGVLILAGWRGDYMQICNLTTTWKGVAPATCFAWMSKIAGAISAGKPTGFWYSASQADFCTTAPTYGSAPAPVYVDVAQ